MSLTISIAVSGTGLQGHIQEIANAASGLGLQLTMVTEPSRASISAAEVAQHLASAKETDIFVAILGHDVDPGVIEDGTNVIGLYAQIGFDRRTPCLIF